MEMDRRLRVTCVRTVRIARARAQGLGRDRPELRRKTAGAPGTVRPWRDHAPPGGCHATEVLAPCALLPGSANDRRILAQWRSRAGNRGLPARGRARSQERSCQADARRTALSVSSPTE